MSGNVIVDPPPENEEDRLVRELLDRIPVRKTAKILAIFAAFFLVVEATLILGVLSVNGVHRLTTFNGALLMMGGAALAWVYTMVFMWPMKQMSVESLRITYRMQRGLNEAKQYAEQDVKPVLKDLKAVVVDAKEILGQFKQRDFGAVEKAIQEISTVVGQNGDFHKTVASLSSGLDTFRKVAKYLEEMRGQIDNPELKARLVHAAKTLDALAEYLDLKVA